MHVDFGTILFLVAAYVSVTEVHSAGSNTTCFGSSNVTNGGHFHAFELVQRSNKLANGCASKDKPLFEVHGNTSTYVENHVIDIKINGAADIYLNIKGIHHRTTNSLPQYAEYKYKFALLSEKDVIWLVSLENMPKSSVSYHIWVSAGSQVIFQGKRKKLSLVISEKLDRKYYLAQALLMKYKQDIFREEELTSFSQISTKRVAAVNISVGPEQGSTQIWNENFTNKCDLVKKDYSSPIVSVENYEASLPTCQWDTSTRMESGLGKAYIVDVRMDDSIDTRKRKIIHLETVISKASGDNVPTAEKTFVVLRSDAFTLWRVNIVRALRELRYPDIKFVIATNDEIDVVSGVEIVKENLDYDRNDSTALTSSIEARYGCAVVSYVQYDSSTDLIILSLSESEVQGDGLKNDPDTLNEKAHDIYRLSKEICEIDKWELVIPSDILNQYGLFEDDETEDIKIGTDSLSCELDFIDGYDLTVDLMKCSSTDDEGNRELELSVTFKTQGGHLFPSVEPVKETVSIPLHCGKRSNTPHSPVKTSCQDGVFFVDIPDNDMQHLNLTAIANCSPKPGGNGYTEYKFHITPDHAECKSHFKDGIFRIAIPKKSSDGVNVSSEPLELTCKDKNVVTTKYILRVYEDFNLRNLLSNSGVIRVPIQPNQQDSDETTYHVQVSLHSNDRLLTVYFSHCYLKQGTRLILTLIKNNCPTTNFVSFVRPMLSSGNNAQHFTVKMGSFFPKYADGLQIVCDVSACCATEPCDDRVESPPRCWNLHGDSCPQKDTLSPFHPDTLESKIFIPATKKIERGDQDVETDEEIEKEANGDPPNDSDSVGIPIVVIIALCAFALGCILVCLMWFIDRQYHSKNENNRKTTKSESDGSRESNSSRSTSSTKTTGSSFSSLFCLKTEKSSSSSSPTSSKDDLEMRPFIKSSSTSIKQPQNHEVRSKVTTDSMQDTNPTTSYRSNGDSKSFVLNSSHAEGPMFCNETITISAPIPETSRHSQAAKQPPPLSASADKTPGFVDAVIHIPHEESSLWQTSSKHDHLPFTDAASLTHEKTTGTSRQPRRPLTSQRTEPISQEDWRLNSCPVGLTQDKFASLKEVTL